MQTITLKVSESAYDQLMGMLNKINPQDLEIIDNSFNAIQAKVIADLDHAKKNGSTSVSIDELEKQLNVMLEKYDS
jgi:hypothetical protein